jgi:polysaccharide biosynthesis/export protein
MSRPRTQETSPGASGLWKGNEVILKPLWESTRPRLLLTLACCLLPVGVALAQQRNPQAGATAPQKSPSGRKGQAPTGKTNTPSIQPADEDYVIGPEDILAINVWKEQEVSRTVPVRPDGKISLPLIGDLQASGLTPVKLQKVVAEKLRAYISNPEVTVIVQEVKSRTFNIVGAVLRPGSYDLAKPLTVLDAVALAGGFQEFAKVKKIYVLRRMGDGSRVRLPFNYKAVVMGRRLEQNVELKPDDTIVVP